LDAKQRLHMTRYVIQKYKLQHLKNAGSCTMYENK